jgi:hypothetical protein
MFKLVHLRKMSVKCVINISTNVLINEILANVFICTLADQARLVPNTTERFVGVMRFVFE